MTDASTPGKGHNRPPPTFGRTTCPECRVVFTKTHHRAQFCSTTHAKAYNNRNVGEGQRIVALAKAWRMARNTSDPSLTQAGKDAFAQLCAELDALNAEDKKAGRVPALKVYRRRQIAGLLDHQGALSR